jgi:hypothetical protein
MKTLLILISASLISAAAAVAAPPGGSPRQLKTRAVVYRPVSQDSRDHQSNVVLFQPGAIDVLVCKSPLPAADAPALADFIRGKCGPPADALEQGFSIRAVYQPKLKRFLLGFSNPGHSPKESERADIAPVAFFYNTAGMIAFNLEDLATASYTFAYLHAYGAENPRIETEHFTLTRLAETELLWPELKKAAVQNGGAAPGQPEPAR